MGHVKHVSPESRKAHQISVMWWRFGLQAMEDHGGEEINPRKVSSVRRSLRDGRGACSKAMVG